MSATITKNDDTLEINLSPLRGFAFSDAKERVKDIPGRRWDNDRKLWLVPAEPAIAQRIIAQIGANPNPECAQWLKESLVAGEVEVTTKLPDDAELLLPWANQRLPHQPEFVNDEPFNGLYPYQRALVDAAVKNRRVIVADDMGLGKTIQALATVEEYKLREKKDGPVLVVAPASVKGSWLREIRRFLPPETPAFVIQGNADKRKEQLQLAADNNGWAIANWDQLLINRASRRTKNGGTRKFWQMKEPLFTEIPWLAVKADEVHRAKNREAKRTKGLWRIQAELMAGLSGTPLMNSPEELWSILRWLFPNEYHERGEAHMPGALSFWAFFNEYVEYYEAPPFGKIITGVKNPDALRFRLKGKLYRRMASGGGRRRIYVDLELNKDQQKAYDEAETQMWIEVERAIREGDESAKRFAKAAAEGELTASTITKIPNGGTRLLRLQQIMENLALVGGEDSSALMDDLEEKMDDSRPAPWVVGCKFRESVSILQRRLEAKGYRVAVYHGDVKPAERTHIEDEFQAGNLDVIVGTIAAMKEGITLTRSNLMYQLTRDWVPAVNEQFESREDRIGQQKKVMVYIPQPTGTVAAGKVEPTNRLKESIVKAVLPQKDIETGGS
jgi:SNF2 family DNA or RNA helicase